MKTVVFDVGNVLLHWDAKIPYRTHFENEFEIEKFFDEVDLYAWNTSLDGGKDWDDGVAELVSKFPHRETEIRIFDEKWHETVPHQIDQSVKVLEKLNQSRQDVFAITNFSAKRWADAQKKFAFLNTFKDVVVSAHEKLLKPDPTIYKVLLERNNLVASDCVFIDDSLNNIQAAKALGFSTVHFDSDTKLAEELQALGCVLC